jgi:hypothetical protein
LAGYPGVKLQLPGNALDISGAAFEINVLAGKRSQGFKLWLDGQVAFRPIIDRLAADEQIRPPCLVADIEDFRKLLEGKAHLQAHLDMARATCLKLVMRHLAPSPTSEARFCSAAAAAGLRLALRAAAMRLCASCRFTALKSTVFTNQYLPQSEVGSKDAVALNERF